jgi:hypothetical protein
MAEVVRYEEFFNMMSNLHIEKANQINSERRAFRLY